MHLKCDGGTVSSPQGGFGYPLFFMTDSSQFSIYQGFSNSVNIRTCWRTYKNTSFWNLFPQFGVVGLSRVPQIHMFNKLQEDTELLVCGPHMAKGWRWDIMFTILWDVILSPTT
jgi:hypothetical protein